MRSRPWAWLLLGIAAAGAGLLPWILHGGALPLQDLWAARETHPFVLLPFSQYEIVDLAAVLVLGGAIGGLVAHLLPGRRTRGQRFLVLLGVLIGQVAAIAQTAGVVGGGLERTTLAFLYLVLLVAGSLLSVVLGVVILLLISSPARAAVVVGTALGAALAATWLGAFIAPPGVSFTGPAWALAALRWIPPILIGIAVGWSGVATAGRIIAAVFAGLAIWIAPAAITAVTVAGGSRAYAHDPTEMIGAAATVLRSALGELDLLVPSLLIAVGVALLGIAVRVVAGRRGNAARA